MTTEEMIALYQAGRSIHLIAAAADLHHRNVQKRLARAGVYDPNRPRPALAGGFDRRHWSPTIANVEKPRELTAENLRKWKLAGIPNDEIASMCGCSIWQVKRVCRQHSVYRHGVGPDKALGYAADILRPHLDKIRMMVSQGAAFKDIAEMYKVPASRIRYFCAANNITRPEPSFSAMAPCTQQWAGFRTGDCGLREAWERGEGPDFRPHNLNVRNTRVAPIRPAGLVLSRSSMAFT